MKLFTNSRYVHKLAVSIIMLIATTIVIHGTNTGTITMRDVSCIFLFIYILKSHYDMTHDT